MSKKNIYQKLYKNMEEYEKALKLNAEKYSEKIKLEAKVEKEMREILEGEIYNNETMYLMSQKLIPVLAQLPQEPILNKYIGEYIDRCKKYLSN